MSSIAMLFSLVKFSYNITLHILLAMTCEWLNYTKWCQKICTVYRGLAGRRGWGGSQGWFFHTFEQKSNHCVFIGVHRQPQFTCQAYMVADSSLTPSVALLVHGVRLSGTTHSIVDHHELTRSQK